MARMDRRTNSYLLPVETAERLQRSIVLTLEGARVIREELRVLSIWDDDAEDQLLRELEENQ